jgi:hypothetical protein
MARKKALAGEPVSAAEIPPEVVGAVVLADLSQIETDAELYCSDSAAQQRIIRAVNRLREIAQADLSPSLLQLLPEVSALLVAERDGLTRA